MKVGGEKKGMKAGGGSDIKNKLGVKWGCGGYDGGSTVVRRGGSSTVTSYLMGGKKNKTDGKFFGESKLKLSTSSLLLLEFP